MGPKQSTKLDKYVLTSFGLRTKNAVKTELRMNSAIRSHTLEATRGGEPWLVIWK